MKQIIFFILLLTSVIYCQPIDTLSSGGSGGITQEQVESIVADSIYGLRLTLANKSLSNLENVAINTDLLPIATGYYNLGSYSKLWTAINLSGIIRWGNSPDNGNYTALGALYPTNPNQVYLPNTSGTLVLGTGYSNQLTYWVNSGLLGSLDPAIYPTLTELSYVKGVTSNIQIQLNGKQASGSYLTSVGTGVANELAYFNTTSTITSLPTATYPNLTQLSYLKGVTSPIQTQLNSKVSSVEIDGLASTTEVTGIIADSLSARMGAILDIDDLAVVKDYEPIIPDSAALLYISGVWQIFDLGATLQLLAEGTITLPDSIVYTSEIQGDTSDYTVDEMDSLLALAGTALQTTDLEGDTLNYTASQMDSLLALAGTALQSIGTGTVGATQIASTTVTAGSYTNTNLTVDADGRITSASNGTGGTVDTTVLATKYYVDSEIETILNEADVRVPFVWAYLQLDTTGSVSDIVDKAEAEVSTLETSGIFGVSANDVVRVAVDSARYKVKYDLAGVPTWTDWLTSTAYYKDVDSAQVQHYSSATNGVTTIQRFYVSNDVDTFTITTVGEALPDETPPAKPTSYVAIGGTSQTQYVSTWTDPVDADLDSIRFYEGTANDSTSLVWIASINEDVQTYTRTGRTANTTYWSAVKAIDDSGNVSYFSNIDSAKTLASAIVDTGFFKFDAEDGVANLTITGAGVTASTDQKYAGSYSYKVSGLGGATRTYADIDFTDVGAGDEDTIWVTYRIYIPAGTSISSNDGWNYASLLIGGGDANGDNGEFALESSTDSIYAWQKPFGTTRTTNWQTGTWHKVEIKYIQGTGANATDSCWVDGTLIYGTSTGAGTVDTDGFRFGAYNWTMNIGEAIYYDDIIFSRNRIVE